MFGYIRPLKDELKVREFEQFKTCYCALCHTLKEEYGFISRFFLNYDFTFLAMLLWDAGEKPEPRCARCAASPLIKKNYCAPTAALRDCAGYSVILSWWKLKDAIKDEGFFKKTRAWFFSILTRRAYKKAARKYPAYAKVVGEKLEKLAELEKENSASLDQAADQFAVLTDALAESETDKARRRTLEQLLYHTGRFIYILDATDDIEEDVRNGRYNPAAGRFNVTDGVLDDLSKKAIEITMRHSINMIGTAYELLPENVWSPVTRNIIYLGMPEVLRRVLDGTWNKAQDSKQR